MAGLPDENLIELLLHLKKTTPEQAKMILNSQPQVSYALMDLMVKINAVNMEVFQQTLSSFGASQIPVPVQPASTPAPVIPTGPTHALKQQQQQQYQGYPLQHPGPASHPNHQTQGYPQHHPQPPAAPRAQVQAAIALPPHLQNLPEDQKATLIKVLSMTPEQINMLAPTDRANIMQLRASLV
ncbi:hypothetical protein BDM02DRAFT_3184656 [Thelephora ganbajun]|uniref:Uncharacterized protein n=1 Tax=Thelephora ganbajun TaxID=370292 RepID=A0ACB6ZP47_THEGA|nr:hypothetical protein BDM02DRAFT_3184656 [Thelephora ganbajun]